MRRAGVFVFDGQSWVVSPSTPEGYWAHLIAALQPRWLHNVVAVSGTSYSYRTTNVAPLYDGIYTRKITGPKVMCDLAGQAELTAGASAASLLATVEAYHTARKNAGIEVTVAHTHPPANAYTGPQNTQRLAYNALILASSVVDAVADLAAVAAADPTGFGDPNNTDYWLVDHPYNNGPATIAAEYQRVLAEIDII